MGFQRKDGGGICLVSEITAARRSQKARAALICKHGGCERTWTEHVIKICLVIYFAVKLFFLFLFQHYL